MWILFLIVAIASILGGLLILLRTANAPKIPKNFKPKPYTEQDDTDW